MYKYESHLHTMEVSRSAMIFDKIITNSYEYKEAVEKGEFKMWCPGFWRKTRGQIETFLYCWFEK